ncbi:MAG TPA: cupredoxin domain-containing protein [Candidatus Methylomirabilis sp.]|nr:cupredoxin domain-containing protein [Candidatus Methylomirabilis sp.]
MAQLSKTGRKRRIHAVRRRNRAIAFGIIAFMVVGLTGIFLWRAIAPIPAVVADVKIQTTMEGFLPQVIRAKVGKPIKILLVNRDTRFHTDGGGRHQFAIDELGVNAKVGPESTQLVTLTPTRVGTYEFYCDVCCGGKQSPSMRGRLEVSA